jgi:hypothetical protein
MICRMAGVLHIIDGQTPTDMLDQLALLAGSEDVIVSCGPARQYAAFDSPVEQVHCPLGLGQLAAWKMRDWAAKAKLMHAWSPTAVPAVKALSRLTGLKAVLSLPCMPAKRDLPGLCRLADRWPFRLVVPTEVARMVLLWGGVRESAVSVLPPAVRAVDQADTASRRQLARRALGVGDGQCLLVAPSEMTPAGGHKYASWAHAILRQLKGDLLLLMPLAGPNVERVRFFAASTGYGPEVFMPEDSCAHGLSRQDALAAGDVAMFLAERDVGVSALAAAMAVGLPIAASNTPDVAECAPHQTAALLSPTCDPRAAAADTLRLMEDRQLAGNLGAAARGRARECFDEQACRRRLVDIHDAAG